MRLILSRWVRRINRQTDRRWLKNGSIYTRIARTHGPGLFGEAILGRSEIGNTSRGVACALLQNKRISGKEPTVGLPMHRTQIKLISAVAFAFNRALDNLKS